MAARPCRIGAGTQSPTVIEALWRHAGRNVDQYRPDPVEMRVLRQLFACRTGELGVHECVCEACGWKGLGLNSCRNRHCPQCQGRATAEWLEARQAKMLPVPHFQVVFTLPAELRTVAFANQPLVYSLLFGAATSVLQDLATQRLSARLGITAVLHTWTSKLEYHPHVHCLVTAGGLRLDDERWVPTREEYLFPVRVLGAMFRGRVLEGLIRALDDGELHLQVDDSAQAAAVARLRSTLRALSKRHPRWVVHVEPPKGRPVEHITKYLARYVKRVAISDARVIEVTDTHVSFRARHGPVRLEGAEFVRRFLLHILPLGFRKIRHCGLYAPGNAKVRLEAARQLLPPTSAAESSASEHAEPDTASPQRSEVCPACGEATVRRFFTARAPPYPIFGASPSTRDPTARNQSAPGSPGPPRTSALTPTTPSLTGNPTRRSVPNPPRHAQSRRLTKPHDCPKRPQPPDAGLFTLSAGSRPPVPFNGEKNRPPTPRATPVRRGAGPFRFELC